MTPRNGFLSIILSLSLTCSALASSPTTYLYIRGIFVGNSPQPVAMEWTEAWKSAEEAAARIPGAFVVNGSGSSMDPLYTPGTILVVAPRDFKNLHAGETVLYYNEEGVPVMHVLVAHARNGWRAAGVNNSVHDSTPVTPDNLAGVVTNAFFPKGKPELGKITHLACN